MRACRPVLVQLLLWVRTRADLVLREGPRVGNTAWRASCSGPTDSYETAASACLRDPNCFALHDFNCDAGGWRACMGSTMEAMQSAATGTRACTMVVVEEGSSLACGYFPGPRVSNSAYYGKDCGAAGDLQGAEAQCGADSACSVLYDYSCDGQGWRSCAHSVDTLQRSSDSDTSACTLVHGCFWQEGSHLPSGPGPQEGSYLPSGFVSGPRVSNSAYFSCGEPVVSLLDAEAQCDANPACSVLHDYDCDGQGWRVCTDSLDTLRRSNPAGREACTRVHGFFWQRRQSTEAAGLAQAPVDNYCSSADPPCVPGLNMVGQGIDITLLDPSDSPTKATKKLALQLTMSQEQTQVRINGTLYQRSVETQYQPMDTQDSGSRYSRMTTDTKIWEEFRANLGFLGDFKKNVAIGSNSGYAHQLRRDLRQSVEKMMVSSKVTLGQLKMNDRERASPYLKAYLADNTVDVIRRDFTKEFGTHFVEKVVLGGRATTTCTLGSCEASQVTAQELKAAAEVRHGNPLDFLPFLAEALSEVVSLPEREGGADFGWSQSEQVRSTSNKMAVDFNRVGGDRHYQGAFQYAEWQRSVDMHTMEPIEVFPREYGPLLRSDPEIPRAKIQAVEEAVADLLTASASRRPVVLAEDPSCAMTSAGSRLAAAALARAVFWCISLWCLWR